MESTKGGFIKLYRSINQHWLWDDPERLWWWIDILLEANYQSKKVLISGQLIDCNRGQVLYSLATWAMRWRVDVSRVRRFLYLLKSDNMIKTESVGKTTRLTVCNYESYNDYRQADDKELTRRKQGSDMEMATTEESKEGKEIKNNNRDATLTPLSPDIICNKLLSNTPSMETRKEPVKKFVPPTEAELVAYLKEKGIPNAKRNAAIFISSYENKDWRLGAGGKGAKMKSWKLTVATWENHGYFILADGSKYIPGQNIIGEQKPKLKF